MKKFLKKSNDAYSIDETYVNVKGAWIYLYRAVDSQGNTLDWMLSATRNQEAAEKFFKQTLKNDHCTSPRVVGVDKNAAYPPAFNNLQKEGVIPKETELRQSKYLNNIIEQDHRSTKKKLRYSQWLQSFETADATISGYESMYMLKKGQVKDVGSKDFMDQKKFIESLFEVAT